MAWSGHGASTSPVRASCRCGRSWGSPLRHCSWSCSWLSCSPAGRGGAHRPPPRRRRRNDHRRPERGGGAARGAARRSGGRARGPADEPESRARIALGLVVTPRPGAALGGLLAAVDDVVQEWDALTGTRMPLVVHVADRGWRELFRSRQRMRRSLATGRTAAPEGRNAARTSTPTVGVVRKGDAMSAENKIKAAAEKVAGKARRSSATSPTTTSSSPRARPSRPRAMSGARPRMSGHVHQVTEGRRRPCGRLLRLRASGRHDPTRRGLRTPGEP